MEEPPAESEIEPLRIVIKTQKAVFCLGGSSKVGVKGRERIGALFTGCLGLDRGQISEPSDKVELNMRLQSQKGRTVQRGDRSRESCTADCLATDLVMCTKMRDEIPTNDLEFVPESELCLPLGDEALPVGCNQSWCLSEFVRLGCM